MLSDLAGTLKGYDVVLSISQAAVNNGLQMLYDHKLDTDGDFHDVSTPIDGGLPAAPAKYAINHDWRIVCNKYKARDGSQKIDQDSGKLIIRKTRLLISTSYTGIWGHIKCPEIELEAGPGDSDKVTIKITFQRDEDAPEDADPLNHQSKDSLLYYWGGERRAPGLESRVINGWTLTWKASLRQAGIMNQIRSTFPTLELPRGS
jgi:hypothetical protein